MCSAFMQKISPSSSLLHIDVLQFANQDRNQNIYISFDCICEIIVNSHKALFSRVKRLKIVNII